MGIFTWKNGNVYEGEFEKSQRHGIGTMRWASGNAYVGKWVHGKKHGKGMYKYVSGGVYEGDWNDDERRGKARCYRALVISTLKSFEDFKLCARS